MLAPIPRSLAVGPLALGRPGVQRRKRDVRVAFVYEQEFARVDLAYPLSPSVSLFFVSLGSYWRKSLRLEQEAAVASIHRAAEKGGSRKPLFSPPDRYAMGPGLSAFCALRGTIEYPTCSGDV